MKLPEKIQWEIWINELVKSQTFYFIKESFTIFTLQSVQRFSRKSLQMQEMPESFFVSIFGKQEETLSHSFITTVATYCQVVTLKLNIFQTQQYFCLLI